MFASPIGPLRFVASERGVTRVCLEGEQLPIDEPSARPLVTQELTEYFAGTRREFTVPLDLTGVTEFRAAVLRELAKVPYGETTSYASSPARWATPKRCARWAAHAPPTRCRCSSRATGCCAPTANLAVTVAG